MASKSSAERQRHAQFVRREYAGLLRQEDALYERFEVLTRRLRHQADLRDGIRSLPPCERLQVIAARMDSQVPVTEQRLAETCRLLDVTEVVREYLSRS